MFDVLIHIFGSYVTCHFFITYCISRKLKSHNLIIVMKNVEDVIINNLSTLQIFLYEDGQKTERYSIEIVNNNY